MSYRAILLCLLTTVSFSATAQKDTTATDRSWFISVYSGTLFGPPGSGTAVSATLMQGIRYNRFALAVGVGYDGYPEWQTLPVFAGVGCDFLRRRLNTFFIHFNAGYSKAWNAASIDNVAFNRKHEGGYFYHPFVGYRIRQGKVALYFSAGYKFQTLTYEQVPLWWGWGTGGTRTTVKQNMERVSVQIGIGL